MLNRWVLSRDRKTATEGAEVTRSGRLFQTRAAATGKARSPTVRSRVRLTINDEDELERSRWRASTSATWQSSPIRYAGADPCTSRHLYTRTDCLNAIRSGAFSQCSWRRIDRKIDVNFDKLANRFFTPQTCAADNIRTFMTRLLMKRDSNGSLCQTRIAFEGRERMFVFAVRFFDGISLCFECGTLASFAVIW